MMAGGRPVSPAPLPSGHWPSELWLTHASVLRGADQRDPGRASGHLRLRTSREGLTTFQSAAWRTSPRSLGTWLLVSLTHRWVTGCAWDAEVVRTGIPYSAHSSEWTED